jgi:hypothetical protein
MRADIAPGGNFPDYELTDHTRTRRKLSELPRHPYDEIDLRTKQGARAA